MAKVLAWRSDVEGGARDEGRVDAGEATISLRARAMGFHTLSDVKLEVLRQRPIWWAGRAYHCPLCDANFPTAQRAAEHVVLEQHPVLRMD